MTQSAQITTALVEVTKLFIEAIGERGIPSGHLYTHLMSQLDLDTYQDIVNSLIKMEVVEVSNHYLSLTELGRELLTKIVNQH